MIGRASTSLSLTLAALALMGCDRFDASAHPAPEVNAKDRAKEAARAPIEAIVKAAVTVTSTCVAGEVRWEADAPDLEGKTLPRHYSRPCIPERCSPSKADLDALREAAYKLNVEIKRDSALRVPSYQGFLALTEAMVSFADTALAGLAGRPPEGEKPLRLSGLSMHYGALVTAYRALYADTSVPVEPPSLTASLAAPGAGGDVCKGWAIERLCDVRALKVPSEHKWRVDPPCIEVESVKK